MRLRWLVLLPLLLSPGAASADGLEQLTRGSIAYRDGAYDVAIEAFSVALAEGDLSARDQVIAYSLRGVARINLDDPVAAIDDYTAALRIEPDNALLFTRRGVAYASTGRYAEAIADYRRALELKPDNAIARDNMADAVRLLRGGAPVPVEAATPAPAAKPPTGRAPPGAGVTAAPAIEADPAPPAARPAEPPPAVTSPPAGVAEPRATEPAFPPPTERAAVPPVVPEPAPPGDEASDDVAPPAAATASPPAPAIEPTPPPAPPSPPPQVAAAAEGDPAAAGRYRATAWVNMRAGPGSSFAALEVLQIGQEVRVRQNVRGWLEVELADGRRGFVYESYLRALE